MANLFDEMSLTVLKHDGWEDESQKPLVDGQDPTIDQAFKLAAYICTGTLAEEVNDQEGNPIKINMEGPLSVFIADSGKVRNVIGDN